MQTGCFYNIPFLIVKLKCVFIDKVNYTKMRIKLFLIVITIMATMGTVLAFKASKVPAQRLYTCNANFICQVVPNLNNVTTTINNPAALQVTASYTFTTANINGLPCNNLTAPCTKPPSIFVIAEQ